MSHPAPAHILDIGCANGVYSFWLARQGYEVTLIDPLVKHIDNS